MKKRILLVEKAGGTRTELLKAIGARCDLFAVSSAEEAIEACRDMGPFAVAVAEHGAHGVSAFDLLKRVNESWPETVGLLIAPAADPATAARAVKEPQVFRCVTTPCDPGALLAAVDAALSHHEVAETYESVSEELRFGKDAMENLTSLLEDRVDRQTSAVRHLQTFAQQLKSATSAREIVHLVAEATSQGLSGRGVQAQLFQASVGGEDVGSGAGREMSTSMQRAPIVVQDREVGEICVDLVGPRGEGLSPLETALLDSIASCTGLAVHHQRSRRELERAQHATILALARLAERRDMETGHHLERVASYCRLVAEGMRSMGLRSESITDEFIEDLVSSSPLHDIGKVGIPDSILLKPGQLTPEEWVIMKTHSEIGGLTLDGVLHEYGTAGFLRMGSEISWCHHEKWDGSGYPRGLKGEEIPLCARIVALADVYDALTTVRPYKSAWTHAAAVEWILSRSGAHFDPEVIAAFSTRLEEADRVRAALADSEDKLQRGALELGGQM